MKQPTTYIMANLRNGTRYTGITSDLVNRVWQQCQRSYAIPRRRDCRVAFGSSQ